MTEIDRVKEEIAKTMYYQHVTSGFKWESEGQWFRDKYLEYANQLLAIKGLGIPDKLVEILDKTRPTCVECRGTGETCLPMGKPSGCLQGFCTNCKDDITCSTCQGTGKGEIDLDKLEVK